MTGTRNESMACLQEFASDTQMRWTSGIEVVVCDFFPHMSEGGVCWNSLLCERVLAVHEEVLAVHETMLTSRGMTSSIMKSCLIFPRDILKSCVY